MTHTVRISGIMQRGQVQRKRLSLDKLSYVFLTIIALIIYVFLTAPFVLVTKSRDRVIACGPSTLVTDWIYDLGPKTPYTGDYSVVPQNKHSELEVDKNIYVWSNDSVWRGFPPAIKSFADVQCRQGFTHPDSFTFYGNLIKSNFIDTTLTYLSLVGQFYRWQVYDAMFATPFFPAKPERLNHWQEDKYFSRLRVSGVNPVVLHKITSFPSKFPVSESRLLEIMDKGVSIKSALSSGRFYFEDYHILNGSDEGEDTTITFPAMCLHYVLNNGTLIPVAIQLHQVPEADKLGIFYPTDKLQQWEFAKIAVQLAFALHHQIDTHLLKTHLHIEVWTIAMHRHLYDTHPIHILLANHLQKTMAINEQAREILIPKIIDHIASTGMSGTLDVANKSYMAFDFMQSGIKEDLIKRGMYDPKASEQTLKDYDYRDFGILMWDAIEEYVTGIVDTFYKDDTTVRSDVSLNAFAREVRVGGRMLGFPSPFAGKAQLIYALTNIMFTTSVQHASINYIQYENLAYIPSTPLSLTLAECPTRREVIDDDFLLAILPPHDKTFPQITSVKSLSRPPNLKEEMITYVIQWDHPQAAKVAERFRRKLDTVTKKMDEMNDKRTDPFMKYNVMYPSRVPKATSI